MSEAEEQGSGEELDAEGRNPTQQRMDAEGTEDVPVDVSWTGEAEGAEAPAEVSFEPDVPLVAEVNREAGEVEDRKRRLKLVGGLMAALGAVAGAAVALVRRRR